MKSALIALIGAGALIAPLASAPEANAMQRPALEKSVNAQSPLVLAADGARGEDGRVDDGERRHRSEDVRTEESHSGYRERSMWNLWGWWGRTEEYDGRDGRDGRGAGGGEGGKGGWSWFGGKGGDGGKGGSSD
jgi:hypothetical protein